MGKLMGMAIDLQRKDKALSVLKSLSKDIRASFEDVIRCTIDAVKDNLIFLQRIEIWEEYVSEPTTSLKQVKAIGDGIKFESNFKKAVTTEPCDILRGCGRSDADDEGYCTEYSAIPALLVARFRASELKLVNDQEEESLAKRTWMLVYRELGITCKEDVNYIKSVCEIAERNMQCIHAREFRRRARGRAVDKILKLCREWDSLETEKLLLNVIDGLSKCFLGSDVYYGALVPGGQLLEFVQASRKSHMVGKFLARGSGISFDAVDNRAQLVVKGMHDALIPQLRVFGDPAQMTKYLPFICTPVKRGKRTVRGVINVDGVGRQDDDEHPEEEELSFLGQICDALGTVIDVKSKEKSLSEFKRDASAPDVTVAQIYGLAIKHLKLNIPMARAMERWCLLLKPIEGTDSVEADSLPQGRPRRVILDIHAARGLAKADLFGKSDPFCIVKWNNKEVGRTPVIYKTLDPEWKNAHFNFVTGLDPKSGSLCIEVWDMDRLGVGDFLGQALIRGADLTHACGPHRQQGLKPKGGQDAQASALIKGNLFFSLKLSEVNEDTQEFDVATVDVKEPTAQEVKNEDEAATEKDTPVFPTLLLQVHKAEGLSKADLFGKSDPFCILKWRQKEIGRTKVIYKTLDPVWDGERFEIQMDEDPKSDAPCELVIEVWDMDAVGVGDFLGEVILRSEDWVKPCAVMRPFVLQPKVKQSSQSSTLVKGNLFLRYRLKDATDPNDKLEEYQACPLLKLDVIKATGLPKVDFFGKSDPFCVIHWNGSVIGQTRILHSTCDPEWEDEHFDVPLIGDDMLTSSLSIDVFYRTRFGGSTFLGQVRLDIKSLEDYRRAKEPVTFALKSKLEGEGPKEVKGELTIRCKYVANPTRKPARPARLCVTYIKGRGIMKARVSKSASLFGVLRYNDIIVGKTATIEPFTEPIWDAGQATINTLSQGGEEAELNSLQFELWDVAVTGEERCLASASMSEVDFRQLSEKEMELNLFPANAKKTPFVILTVSCRVENLVESDPNYLADPELSRLHLQVHRAENLGGTNIFGKPNPFCIVKWDGQEVGRTAITSKTLNPIWEEAVFDIEMSKALPQTELSVEVWDMGTLDVGAFLGQITLARKVMLRSSEGEMLVKLKKRPGEDANQKTVQGSLAISYMKIEGDEAELAETKQFLSLDIYEARGLVKSDRFGKADPVCVIKWNGKQVGKTKAVPGTLNPSWDDEHFDVRLTGNPLKGTLAVEVWGNMDSAGKGSNSLGQVVLTGLELQTPTDGAVAIDLRTKEGQDHGGVLRGYMTMSFSTRDKQGRVINMGSSAPQAGNKVNQMVLNVRILKAMNLFSGGKRQSSYFIIKWSGREVFRSQTVSSTGDPDFAQAEAVSLSLPKDRDKCWFQVEILNQGFLGDELMGTLSMRGDIVLHTASEARSYRLTRVDDDGSKLPSLESYLVMEIHPDSKAWTKSARLLSQKPSIILQIHNARQLAKADLFGYSDPFCIVFWGGKEVGRTKVIDNTLNPDWDDEVFDLELPQDPSSTYLVVECWDMDALKVGDFLGQVTLPCSSMIRMPPDLIDYALKEKDGSGKTDQNTKKKGSLVQGSLGLSIRSKEVSCDINLKYELQPCRKSMEGKKVIVTNVSLGPLELYNLFQSSSMTPSSCILYAEREMVVVSVTDFRIQIGENEFGAPEWCNRYSLVACGSPNYSTYEDAVFARQIMVELQSSLQRKRGIEYRVALRAKSLQDMRAVANNFTAYDGLETFYRALFQCFESPLMGCDIYLGLVKNGGAVIRYVHCSENSKMLNKELYRGDGISYKCVGTGYHTFILVQGPPANDFRQLGWQRRNVRARRGNHSLVSKVEVLGSKPRATLPFVVCPLLHGRCTVGVLGCDHFDQMGKGTAEERHPEPGVVDYLKVAAEIIGTGFNLKRRHDALIQLSGVVEDPYALPEHVFGQCMKVALHNITFACKAEIWHLDERWDLHIIASLGYAPETTEGNNILRVFKTSLELYGENTSLMAGLDFFISMKCGGLERRTSLKCTDDKPEWEEQLDFKLSPSVKCLWGELWTVTCKDRVREIVATCKFDIAEVCGEDRKTLETYLYGENAEVVGRFTIEALLQPIVELSMDLMQKTTQSDVENKSFRVTIISANGLAKADLVGDSDPYVIVKWNGKELGRTAVKASNLNPVWDFEVFNMNIPQMAPSTELVLEVWDKDEGMTGDFLGQVVVGGDTLLRCTREPITCTLQDKIGGKSKNIQGTLTFTVEVREGIFVEGRVGQVDKKLKDKMQQLVSTVRHAMGWYEDKDVTQGTVENSVLRVQFIDARKLKKKLVMGIIRVNNVESGCTEVVSGSTSPKFTNQVFMLDIAAGHRTQAHVCIELWGVSAKSHHPIHFLGQVVLEGAQLMRIPKGDVDYDLSEGKGRGTYFARLVRGTVCLNISWRQMQPSSSLETIVSADSSPAPLASLEEKRMLKLVILSAKELPRADTFGSSDPYVIIKWQGQEVGRTKVIWNCLDPLYEDEIFFVTVDDEDDPDTSLTLEVWDKDLVGPGDFLGDVTLKGDDLEKVYKEQALDLARHGQKQGKVVISLAPHDRRYTREVVELKVMKAHGLANADFMGKSDPFVIVKWNGKEVGRTKVKNDTLNPVWNESFFLHIPWDRREISVRLEVWDMDPAGTGDFLGQVEIGPEEILQNPTASINYLLNRKQRQTDKLNLIQGELELKWAHRWIKKVVSLPVKVEPPPRKEIHNLAMDVRVVDDPMAEELRRKREGLTLPNLQARTQALADLCDSVIGTTSYQKKKEEREILARQEIATPPTEEGVGDNDEEEDDDEEGTEGQETSLLGVQKREPEPETSVLAEVPSGQVVTAVVKNTASTVLRGVHYDRLILIFGDDGAKAVNRPTPGYALVVYCRAREVYTEDRAFGRTVAESVSQQLALIRRRHARSDARQQLKYRINDLVTPGRLTYFTGTDIDLCNHVLGTIAPCLGQDCITRVYYLGPSGDALIRVASSVTTEQQRVRLERNPGSELLFRCNERKLVLFMNKAKCRVGHPAWATIKQADMPLSTVPENNDEDCILIPLWTRDYSIGVLQVTHLDNLTVEMLNRDIDRTRQELQLDEGVLELLSHVGSSLGRWIDDHRRQAALGDLTALALSKKKEDHSMVKVLRKAVDSIKLACPHVTSVDVWHLTVNKSISTNNAQQDMQEDDISDVSRSGKRTPPALPSPTTAKSKYLLNRELTKKMSRKSLAANSNEGTEDQELSVEEEATDADVSVCLPIVQAILARIMMLYVDAPTIITLASNALGITVKNIILRTTDKGMTTLRDGSFRWQVLEMPPPTDIGLLGKEWYRNLRHGTLPYFWSSSNHLILLIRAQQSQEKEEKEEEDGEDGSETERENQESEDEGHNQKKLRKHKKKRKGHTDQGRTKGDPQEREVEEGLAIALKGNMDTADLSYLTRLAITVAKILYVDNK